MPDVPNFMTKADVVGKNDDLIAARILAGQPRQSLRLVPVTAAPRQRFRIESTNFDRLDVAIDFRSSLSQDVTVPSFVVSLPAPAPAGSQLKGQGYRGGWGLVVSTRLRT